MKQIGLLLTLLLLFLVACGPSGADVVGQAEIEEPAEASPPSATDETVDGDEDIPATESEAVTPSESNDDPILARDRDWKLGDTDDPAVTIIEYGDFQ